MNLAFKVYGDKLAGVQKRVTDYGAGGLAFSGRGNCQKMGFTAIGDEVAGLMLRPRGKANRAGRSCAASKDVLRQVFSPVLERQPRGARQGEKARHKKYP